MGTASQAFQTGSLPRVLETSVTYDLLGDGATNNDTNWLLAIAALNANGGKLYLPNGTYVLTSAAAATISANNVTIEGESKRGTILQFADGAYTALSATGQNLQLKNITIGGTVTTSTTLTLVAFSGTTPYPVFEDVLLNNADTLLSITGTHYVAKYRGVETAGYNKAIDIDNTGSKADILFEGLTLGTATVGTDPCVTTAGNGCRFDGVYAETQTQAKKLFDLNNGAGRVLIDGIDALDSGGIDVGANVTLNISGNMFDVWDSGASNTFSTSGGSVLIADGLFMDFTSLGTNRGVNASGTVLWSGGRISKCATGLQCTTGLVTGAAIENCTTGINRAGSNFVIDKNSLRFASNTTDISSAFTTFADADTTPSVLNNDIFKTANTGATTITGFDDGFAGQTIRVIFDDANTTVDFTGTTLKGNGGANWSPAVDDHMTCLFDGTDWFCDISDNTA